MKKFDVFVFGTGTAGKLVAKQCAKAGKSVAIIDNRAYGGTCSQRGCDPKKLMLASTEALQLAQDMQGDGIQGDITLDFHAAHRYAHRYVDDIPNNTEEALKKEGITCFHGEAHFVDSHHIVLEDQKIQSDIFVIATGMTTLPLGIPGASHLLTSDDFFQLTKAPEKVVFVGGGYIGMEFGHMLARAGSKVYILEKSDQLLGPFEAFTASFVERASEELGIEIIKNAQVSSLEENGDRLTVHYAMDDGMHQITADKVFNTAGRVPSISSLQLENAGVVTDKKGVVVNKYLQSTTQDHFYACGDVSSKSLPLTPLSSREAKVVADNITKNPRELDIPAIPSVVFTLPNCAGIGLTEQQAKEQGKDYQIIQKDASAWFNNKRINANFYAYKLVVEKSSDLILGAHIVGHGASEQINMFAIAMKARMTMDALQDTIFTYPSWGNDIISF
ncbi:dihydrolipoyl dehydrogenase family protein [Nonlabens xiamenensis]|uniref:dihydrolipoyl dehydrogenase family protein n=1 Tax=Nonlabens xiamenensis TaxID=2341043 RepID=UPI000F60A1FB|nr:NAD(P)/FAD-dependent oxidoreductase [Nonlabens xiamenensis]